MSSAIDLTGSRIGKLEILKRKRENNRTYYYCKCDCGNEKWIRADSLTKKNPTESCGCLGKETQFKAIDITGKRYNRLVAIKPTNKRDKNNGSIIWECICDCGNPKDAAAYLLEEGSIQSCGCLFKEISSKHIRLAIKAHLAKNIINGTNIPAISRKTLKKNNKSGITGLHWSKERKKWVAQIKFKNSHYNLGRFDNIEDARKAREKAKEELHNKFLRSLEQNNEDNKYR